MFTHSMELQSSPKLDLAVVVPTYNERENIPEVIARLNQALDGLEWEVIFVDDDSPDGTAEVVREFAVHDRRVRLLHRIGRRGLSSACIEGILATSTECVAVMDADLQHDERVLPRMLERMRDEDLDVVVATRNGHGGSMGDFSSTRVWLSNMGMKLSRLACRCDVSDPMSGFFLVKRNFFVEVAHRLHGGGFKILVDILSSSEQETRVAEVGYRFGERLHGKSKLDANAELEYLVLITSRFLRGVSPQFILFALVGSLGVGVHLSVLFLLYRFMKVDFAVSQLAATFTAMTGNFFLNNIITFRDQRLRGIRMWTGLVAFWAACSFGAWVNVSFARMLFLAHIPWVMAGMGGTVVSSVWNYTISSILTWQKAVRPTSVVKHEDVGEMDEQLLAEALSRESELSV
ncbi:MAG TPA: glycosyltransferase family 2 protein [candidate division Zixibacteria bacterium]|nr:glycosyltransferase family 2 protein [candidate division Zixibacteria bacterium]